jgi:hypothetical protein
MNPIEWDKQETFTAPNGVTAMRYAVSNRNGVTYEFSMHDATIQTMLPQTYWIPVFTAPVNNAKIDRIDGRLVVLCGFGKANDPVGNLVLMRVATIPGFSVERLACVIALILATLARFGIQPDKHMMDTIRGN